MILGYLNRFKTFSNTPTPENSLNDLIEAALKFVILFSVFYYATLQYHVLDQALYRDIIEGLLVGFSLFCAFLLWGGIDEVYFRIFQKKLIPTFGYSPFLLLFIYTAAITILYPLKENLWDIEKSWVLRYYCRHLPFALLVFAVYIQRQYKNFIIDDLIIKLNARLDKSTGQEREPRSSQARESYISLQVDKGQRSFHPSEISHISVEGHYLEIVCRQSDDFEEICVRKTLTEILEELPPEGFLRIHRSHVVNLDYIVHLKKINRQYHVQLLNESCLPISRSQLPNVLSKMEPKT